MNNCSLPAVSMIRSDCVVCGRLATRSATPMGASWMQRHRWRRLRMPDMNGQPRIDVTGSPEPGDEQRDACLRQIRSLADHGLLTQTSGNVSVRVGDRHLLITPSGMDYYEMRSDDLVLLGLDGSVVAGRRRPSSEVPLHLAVYAARSDLRAIVHTHSPLATTFAVVNRPIEAVHYMVTTLAQTSIEVAPYALFGSAKLAANVTATFTAPSRAVLLANHGVVAAGPNLAAAATAAETVELLAGLHLRSLALGVPRVLSDGELKAVTKQIDALSYAEIAQ
jgi:L-fuculose-phosphate aldolase